MEAGIIGVGEPLSSVTISIFNLPPAAQRYCYVCSHGGTNINKSFLALGGSRRASTAHSRIERLDESSNTDASFPHSVT